VRIHLVAPMGLELNYIESQLARFFGKSQFETMVKENVMVDAEAKSGNIARFFPIPGLSMGFNSRALHFYPHKDCDFKVDEYGNPTTIREECRAAGVELSDDNVGLFYPGAKLGWFIKEIQKTLTTYGESLDSTHAYLSSCRIEDLFLWGCQGGDEYGAPNGIPWSGRDWTSGGPASCSPITDNNSICSVDNLKQKLSEYIIATNSDPISEQELTKRATQASMICNAESGGNPNSLNDGCIKGTTVDYSVGLFQINLLAHNCPQYFSFTWNPPSCILNSPYTLVDVELCAAPLFNPDTNIQKAFQLSGAGSNWWAWSTARPQHCNICSASKVCNGLPE